MYTQNRLQNTTYCSLAAIARKRLLCSISCMPAWNTSLYSARKSTELPSTREDVYAFGGVIYELYTVLELRGG